VSQIDTSQLSRTPSSVSAAAAAAIAAKQKLVLAQNNPHLKSHRRRQSALIDTEYIKLAEKIEEKRMPGYVPQGMEQSAGLADVLYSRWLEGLKGRWGMV
jgi:serine/threonine-protein kinase 24/25/MST4